MIVAVIDARTGEQFYAVDGKRYPYDLAALQGQSGLTDAQVDDLFLRAMAE